MAIDPTFLDQLKKLTLLSRRRVSSVYAGTKKAVQTGKGIEVVDYTEYFPGDDLKTVDWKIYGRTEKLYIKRFEEEKNLLMHLLVDSSSSMNFKTGKMLKFDYAGSIAAGFAYLTVNENEKFSLTLYADNIREILKPSKGKTHFFNAIEVLNNAWLSGETNLARCMSQYANTIKSKSFVVIISDFLEPIETLREGIYMIARHSKELMLVQVLDEGEIKLGWSDDVLFEEPESRNTERTYLSPTFKRDYYNSLKNHVYALKGICDDVKADFYTVSTGKPIFDSFVTVVKREMENAVSI